MSPTTVVVGASIGGVRTAKALRTAGYAGDVILVGDETALPYDKPPLSKSLLAGSAAVEDITLLTREQAAAASIQLELGRAATGVDLDACEVELADGTCIHFDDLVVATGARPRPSPWGAPPGVHLLRTLGDATALGAALSRGGSLVVIGAGFVGAEVAATARGLGVEPVTLIDPVAVPLSRSLAAGVARRIGELHNARGVHTRFGVGVSGIDHSETGLRVHLDDGSVIEADSAVVGIGAQPNTEWLDGSGLVLDDGVVCDRFGRAVDSHANVHAVGDVARWWHPAHEQFRRVEHWTNAVDQASCVAHNIVRSDEPRAHIPIDYVWSDQYDWKIQMVGRTSDDLRQIEVAGQDPDRCFAVLYSDAAATIAGAVVVNWPRALIACRRAVMSGATLDEVRGRLGGLRSRSVEASAAPGLG
ncbi:NAD(P)/FAD-dependent oxidoreductase [Pseudonocardia sp.]|uniref:NAD(P)/FAD-dependent oxidoreductase n=1 Tax=Pseudonocardia sp. TaxID=60912 RepID=UPI003D0EA838